MISLLNTARDKLGSEVSPSSAIITDLSWPDSTLQPSGGVESHLTARNLDMHNRLTDLKSAANKYIYDYFVADMFLY